MNSVTPLAGESDPGYIPTIDVIRIVRQHRTLDYIRQMAMRESQGNYCASFDGDELLDRALFVEMACRGILDANRWML